MIYNITKNIHQSTLNFFKKVVKIFLKLNRNKICFSWDKLTSKIASSRILTTLYGKYGNTGQYQQFHSQELHGIKLLQRKTWQEKLSNSFQKSTDKENTHTHTHTQSRKSWYQWDLPQTHTKIHEPKVFDNLWQFEGLLKTYLYEKKTMLTFYNIESKSCSAVSDSMRSHGLQSMESPGQDTGRVAVPFSWVSSQPWDQTQIFLIAGGFFTNWATGKPKNTGVGSLSFSRGSSRLRNQTRVLCIAGRFFTNWAIGEALGGYLFWRSSIFELEKEMATHSSVLAWRIPGTEEPGGLLSVGSHRVGHDWCD